MNITDTATMNITLDIAAVLGTVIWPIIIGVLLIIYREKIPLLFIWLGEHIKKVEFQGISVQLFEAKAFIPDVSKAANEPDMRSRSSAMAVNSSSMPVFVLQLTNKGTADYAVVDLGNGKKWLSSRIFIMTILYHLMKGVKGIVFLESTEITRKKNVGWAEPQKIVNAFTRRYNWFGEEYIKAYLSLTIDEKVNDLRKTGDNNAVSANVVYTHFDIFSDGHLSYKYFSPDNPYLSIRLMQEFLQRIQKSELLPVDKPNEYVLVDSKPDTYEHSRWIDAGKLEDLLGTDLCRSSVRLSDLKSLSKSEKLRAFLSLPNRFVAVTSENGRFEYLIDRDVLLEEVAKKISVESVDGSGSE